MRSSMTNWMQQRDRIWSCMSVAPLFILSSTIDVRVPLGAKPVLAPILFPIKRLYNGLPGRMPFAAFLARWRRMDVPVEDAAQTGPSS